jgi:large subunit ribosomal protein L4
MVVVEDFGSQLLRPKTKDLISAMTRWGAQADEKILLIVAERQENIYLSARNVANLKLILANNLNIYDLLSADRLLVTAPALQKIQEVYGD